MSKLHCIVCVDKIEEINPAIKKKEDEGWEFVPPITHLPSVFVATNEPIRVNPEGFVLTFVKCNA